jgi:hypothetical protein
MAKKELAKTNQTEVVYSLKELVEGYIEARDRIKKFQEEIEPVKKAKEYIQNELIRIFKGRGEYSSRIEGATVSLSVRKTAVIVDEAKVIGQLKEAGLTDYISESLNDLFEQPKKDMAAGKAPLLEGIEIRETEFISVRENDKDDARKVVTQDFHKLNQ